MVSTRVVATVVAVEDAAMPRDWLVFEEQGSPIIAVKESLVGTVQAAQVALECWRYVGGSSGLRGVVAVA